METLGDEVSSVRIGEAVMVGLKALDHVAYIRFASIYKDFSDPGDFAEIAERVEKEARAARPRQIAVSGASQAGHRPRPPAARPEYRQGGARDAQFRADRDAAGRAARRLAQSRRRTGRERRRCRARTGAGLRHRPETAIADCSTVFASTVRRRDLVMPVVAPAEMADVIAASAERSAILFGPERSGLETEEVALAQRDRHRADQSRIRLAQPGPGGDPARLRMVEAKRACPASGQGA